MCEGAAPVRAQNARSHPDSTQQTMPEPRGGDVPSALGGAAGWGGSVEYGSYFQNNNIVWALRGKK